MTVDEAIKAVGAKDALLSDEERVFLDEQGYLPLPGILSDEQLIGLRRRYDQILEAEGEEAGLEVHQEKGTHRLANLVDKGPEFEVCFTQPKVISAIRHVLGAEFKLSSLNGRAALPGHGLQGLHADWAKGVEPGDYYVCNSVWLLTDFTEDNGATRVVPGSHNSRQHPRDALDDATAPHPDQVLLTAKAGTVVIFNAHMWHGGTLNQTSEPRYGLHGYYTRRDQKQQTNQRESLSQETMDRLSVAQRTILDIC
jgi:ectoine hydroxylase-related dioxygenase (phytanoyl-CoA dioxygenase family)